MQRKKRSRFEIIHDVLMQCKNGAKRTWIMYGSNLSYDLTTNYLNELMKRGFIENRDGLYYLTESGKKLLDLLDTYITKKKELDAIMKQIKEQYTETPAEVHVTTS